MKSIEIYGVVVEYYEGGEFSQFLKEEAKRRRREEAVQQAHRWLAEHDFGDAEYSDIYKDVHGVRPRW